jgi:hypothetical protein
VSEIQSRHYLFEKESRKMVISKGELKKSQVHAKISFP